MQRNVIVLEAPNGFTFKITEQGAGGIGIKLIYQVASEYYGDYTNPTIPEGWSYVEGSWENGYVIQDSNGNQFVWVPVGFLDSNGNINDMYLLEKFGRRNYQNDNFSGSNFFEPCSEGFLKQWESVRKYGGFYISRYQISKTKNGVAQSVKGEMPWTDITWYQAAEAAMKFGNDSTVMSHLTFGAEYDSVLEWFIKSGARTKDEISKNSSNWGNFWDNNLKAQRLLPAGSHSEWETNKIFDFAGNVSEWTQEHFGEIQRVIRGGGYFEFGEYSTCSERTENFMWNTALSIGFRAVLCIK